MRSQPNSGKVTVGVMGVMGVMGVRCQRCQTQNGGVQKNVEQKFNNIIYIYILYY